MARYEIVERHDEPTTWWTARDETGHWVRNTQTQRGAEDCEEKLKTVLSSIKPDKVVKVVEL